jgi:hypothetical protein
LKAIEKMMLGKAKQYLHIAIGNNHDDIFMCKENGPQNGFQGP